MALHVLLVVATALATQAPGSAAPDFTLQTLAGRPVFLNFWASWCVPCRAEMRDIIDAQGAHTQQHLVVLAINLTDQERMADVRRFVTELQMPFPVLLDRKGKVRKSYRLRGVPTSVFVDTLGIVRLVNQGPITPEMIRRGLTEILPAP